MRAQSDDFGIWTDVNVEKELGNYWELEGGIEFRSRDKVRKADRWSGNIGASYELTDWLKASAGYSLLYDNRHKLNTKGNKYADYWSVRHRFNVSLTASKTFGRLSISLRERWQYTYRPEKTVMRYYVSSGAEDGEHTFNAKGKNVWRNRLQLKYRINKRWRPYANAETNVSNGLDKIRYTAGTEIRLTKQHWLDAKYIYQHVYDDDDEEGNLHVIGIGYTYKF
jgi:hypothetical protein